MFLAVYLLFGAVPHVSAQQALLQPLSDLEESFSDTRPVSGGVLVGFSVIASPASNKPQLESYIPADWANSNICLWLKSRDGQYEAYQSYLVADEWAGGILPFPLDSEYRKYLSRTDAEGFATLVLKGDCWQMGRVEVAMTVWSKGCR